ncbi:TPA: DUF3024 domain-containing protein [Serratia liquefaciens]
MIFSKLELHDIKKALWPLMEKIRPHQQLRALLDVAYRIDGRNIEIFMVQPQLGSEPHETSTVKISHIRDQDEWRVYCMRITQKWALYDKAKTLDDALEIVSIDKHGCFFG